VRAPAPALDLDFAGVLLGAALAAMLLLGPLTARFRRFLGIPYHLWRPWHRRGMSLAVVLVAFHAPLVSDDFSLSRPGPALVAGVSVLGLWVLLLAWTRLLRPRLLSRRAFVVTESTLAGRDTRHIALEPRDGKPLAHAPGQFAFFTFVSSGLEPERHPWTISSAPGSRLLTLTVRCSGDYTNRLPLLAPGDTCLVEGAFGLFSDTAMDLDPGEHLVLLAGGVGVTPFLSMLRHARSGGSGTAGRPITLIWANRKVEDILYPAGLAELEQDPAIVIHHVMTRQPTFPGPRGHLDADMLGHLLPGLDPGAATAMVCGPGDFTRQTIKALKKLSLPASRIHSEAFAL
jgi:predicted ferric reductase